MDGIEVRLADLDDAAARARRRSEMLPAEGASAPGARAFGSAELAAAVDAFFAATSRETAQVRRATTSIGDRLEACGRAYRECDTGVGDSLLRLSSRLGGGASGVGIPR
jgi:hypothetical protein